MQCPTPGGPPDVFSWAIRPHDADDWPGDQLCKAVALNFRNIPFGNMHRLTQICVCICMYVCMCFVHNMNNDRYIRVYTHKYILYNYVNTPETEWRVCLRYIWKYDASCGSIGKNYASSSHRPSICSLKITLGDSLLVKWSNPQPKRAKKYVQDILVDAC